MSDFITLQYTSISRFLPYLLGRREQHRGVVEPFFFFEMEPQCDIQTNVANLFAAEDGKLRTANGVTRPNARVFADLCLLLNCA